MLATGEHTHTHEIRASLSAQKKSCFYVFFFFFFPLCLQYMQYVCIGERERERDAFCCIKYDVTTPLSTAIAAAALIRRRLGEGKQNTHAHSLTPKTCLARECVCDVRTVPPCIVMQLSLLNYSENVVY